LPRKASNRFRALIHAIETTLLAGPDNDVGQYLTKSTIRKIHEAIQDPNSTMNDLRLLLWHAVKPEYAQMNKEPPYCLKYHHNFLSKFQTAYKSCQMRPHSQEQQIMAHTQEIVDTVDTDNKTIIPPHIIMTTAPSMEPGSKRIKMDNLLEEQYQTALTQHWTPRAVCRILGSGEQTRIESCIIRIPESMVESHYSSPN
jgi:hypothetical protein